LITPYDLLRQEKEKFLLQELNALTYHHMNHCMEYRMMIDKSGGFHDVLRLEELPYLPVQLFKLATLKSIPDEDVVKTLTSSGTTGQQVSKIYLDKETAMNQTKVLVDVMNPILGGKRHPMIILDTKSVLKNRQSFSARGAGILGFSNFGRKHFYALNDDMSIDWDGLKDFANVHTGTRILLFGFTFMIWKYFYLAAKEANVTLNLDDSVLIHGGGWKKMQDEAVDPASFSNSLKLQFGIQKVHNYYGMVEQVGSIFVECEHGHLHAPNYADLIIRDPITFDPLPVGRQGLIQVISTLPKSYPGHSLLTEDLGTVLGQDDCPCGWNGKYFNVAGRIPKAELRGCSDTFAFDKKVAQ